VDGSVAGQLLANRIVLKGTTLRVAGLSRSGAARTAKTLR
jgi:hypothetical protein